MGVHVGLKNHLLNNDIADLEQFFSDSAAFSSWLPAISRKTNPVGLQLSV
jgi:hypothetical protein